MRQEIQESIERVDKIRQDVKTGAATASQLEQSTQNLRAAIPQIQATTTHLLSLVQLVKAQTTTEKGKPALNAATIQELQSKTGLNNVQAKQVGEYLHANMPAIEASLRNAQAQIEQLKRPGAINEATAQSGFLGAWSTALKHIIPIGTILGIGK
jgi:chromosome segregation ATPase